MPPSIAVPDMAEGVEWAFEIPSIGLERKAYFPFRLRFFDPGVCSRSGWTVSSRDIAFVVRSEHRSNSFERLV